MNSILNMPANPSLNKEADHDRPSSDIKMTAVDPRDAGLVARGLMYNKV